MQEESITTENFNPKITADNYTFNALHSGDRQAGVSVIYDPDSNKDVYNTYCLELKLLKELFTKEFDTLDEALVCLHKEFGSWKIEDLSAAPVRTGCCGGGGGGGGGGGTGCCGGGGGCSKH